MNKEHVLPFPAGRPDPYQLLVDEPSFDPSKHLAFKKKGKGPQAPFEYESLQAVLALWTLVCWVQECTIADLHHLSLVVLAEVLDENNVAFLCLVGR